MSDIIKVSVPVDLALDLRKRAAELNMTAPEYLRTLARMDIDTQNYQKAATYINYVFNKLVDYQQELGIYCMPLSNVPIVKLPELS